MMSLIPRGYISRAFFAAAVATLLAIPVLCQDDPETLVVTPVNPRGWTSAAPTADTRPGGIVDLVLDSNAPLGTGALKLVTDSTNEAKAQYMHAADTALSAITDLSYSTKQISASFVNGAPSYQLVVCLGGITSTSCTGFTTLVYEPYDNGFAINPGQWQDWNVYAGALWSSKDYSSGTCTVSAGHGGPPFYSIGALASACPDARVIAYGVNVGTFNPSYDTRVDKFVFQNTTYDFELYSTPSTMDDCKKGGWSTFNPPTGAFKNQGQCVSSTVPQ